MNSKIKILLIIPAYNEQENIVNTINKINYFNKKQVNNNKQTYDYIVINDGSTDDTEKVLCNNNIKHIKLGCNLGIGGAVQTGYKYALYNNYDIAIQYDGDGQHDVSCVFNVVDPILNGHADMVIGSRFIDCTSSKFKSNTTRRIGINLISFFIKLFGRKKIFDTTSGFRAVNKKIICKFANTYPNEYPEPVSTTSILKQGYIVKEVPVSMNEREAGKSSINSIKSIYYMINVCFSIFIEGIGGYKNES